MDPGDVRRVSNGSNAGSFSTLLSTPVQNNTSTTSDGRRDTDEMLGALVGSLSSMKFGSSEGAETYVDFDGVGNEEKQIPLSKHKRMGADTIEGTPIFAAKKLNGNPTPDMSYFLKPPTLPTEIAPAVRLTLPLKSSSGLKVICSASDDHNTGEHQENARRTALLCGLQEGCLRRAAVASNITWIESKDIPMPPITDLLRVHDIEYLQHLENKCRQSKQPGSYRNIPPFQAPAGYLDCDTPLVEQSLDAAKRFCGAAMTAVDQLISEYLNELQEEGGCTPQNIFVVGRPPGHHAGPNGCVPSSTFWKAPGMTSSGFCLLNTVAVAAAYARHQYGRQVRLSEKSLSRAPRIAIVDIDIHHGNGTEEIVRNLRPHQTFLPLPSSWAPISKLSYKPWLNEQDSDEVFFASIHLFANEDFYPGSGAEAQNSSSDNIVNIGLTPVGPGPWDHKARHKLTQAKKDDCCARASAEFRQKVLTMLLPRLQAFQADILFLSAGFDAHHDDLYHYLTEDDIHWVTQQMMMVTGREVNPHHIGVISVLEGGYSLAGVPSADSVPAGGRGTKKRTPGGGPANANNVNIPGSIIPVDPATMFGQQPGDGGLVKSVLAHAAALAGRRSWI